LGSAAAGHSTENLEWMQRVEELVRDGNDDAAESGRRGNG
jgi:hypothetical protein